MIQVETNTIKQKVADHLNPEINTKAGPVINIKGLYKSFGKIQIY